MTLAVDAACAVSPPSLSYPYQHYVTPSLFFSLSSQFFISIFPRLLPRPLFLPFVSFVVSFLRVVSILSYCLLFFIFRVSLPSSLFTTSFPHEDQPSVSLFFLPLISFDLPVSLFSLFSLSPISFLVLGSVFSPPTLSAAYFSTFPPSPLRFDSSRSRSASILLYLYFHSYRDATSESRLERSIYAVLDLSALVLRSLIVPLVRSCTLRLPILPIPSWKACSRGSDTAISMQSFSRDCFNPETTLLFLSLEIQLVLGTYDKRDLSSLSP